MKYPCADTGCNGNTRNPGELCDDCKKRQAEQEQAESRNRWKYAGWGRWENLEDAKNHKVTK
jgi:hypothetical protein